MKDISVVNHQDQRVLTTQQLAESFGTEPQIITNNFQRNIERFREGVHYFKLEGAELRAFKAVPQIDLSPSVNRVYLWTKRGSARHAKMLSTDEAWAVYEELEESYFTQRVIPFLVPKTFSEALRLAADTWEQNESLKLRNVQQNQIIQEMLPKVTYYDLILQSQTALTITQIAKDYGMSAVAMNNLLHELGAQFKQGDTWLLYQKYVGFGYTTSITYPYTNSHDEQCSRLHTYWTQKGRLFIYNLLKNEKGILPKMERLELTPVKASKRKEGTYQCSTIAPRNTSLKLV